MLFLPHKQQCQKSEGKTLVIDWCVSKSRLWIRVSRDHKRRGRTWKGECGRHNSTWFISNCHRPIYLRQEDHVFVVVCLFVSNFAQKLPNGFPWNFQEDWQWANEQMIKYWWQSGSGIRIRTRICIVTLVRRALAEVCTVPVLLVSFTRCTHCIFTNKCERGFLQLTQPSLSTQGLQESGSWLSTSQGLHPPSEEKDRSWSISRGLIFRRPQDKLWTTTKISAVSLQFTSRTHDKCFYDKWQT